MAQYLSRINMAYNVMSYFHILMLVVIVTFSIGSLLRKHKLDSFQWQQIAELTILNSVQAAFEFQFDKALVSVDCGE